MRSALIHGVLLLVMLGYGYRTWTAAPPVAAVVTGKVVMWDGALGELTKVEYTVGKRTVTLERRQAGAERYWWGRETKAATPPPPPPSSGSGAPPAPPAAPAPTTREFPVGAGGDKLVAAATAGRALLRLGALAEADKAQYKLDKDTATLALTFAGGARTLAIGGKVNGELNRYALDPATGQGYVVPADLVQPIDSGEATLRLTDPLGAPLDAIGAVELAADGKTRRAVRQTVTSDKGLTTKTWADAATGAADQTLANFVDAALGLRPTRYEVDLPADQLTTLVTLTIADAKGAPLGTWALLRRTQPGAPADGATPTPVVDYYVQTSRGRVPGAVTRSSAERLAGDIATALP